MVLGQSYDFVVEVTSDAQYISVMAMTSAFFPGRYVIAQPLARSGAGTSATLTVTFTTKSSTSGLPDGAPVSVIVGVRYKGGVVASHRYDYNVSVP